MQQIMIALPDGNRLLPGNLSSGGVGFVLEEGGSLKVGDRIRVRIALPDQEEAAELNAEVAHVQCPEPRRSGHVYIGARFTELDALVGNPLFRFVEECALLTIAELPLPNLPRVRMETAVCL